MRKEAQNYLCLFFIDGNTDDTDVKDEDRFVDKTSELFVLMRSAKSPDFAVLCKKFPTFLL